MVYLRILSRLRLADTKGYMKATASEYIRDCPLRLVSLDVKLHDARIKSEMKKCIEDDNTR